MPSNSTFTANILIVDDEAPNLLLLEKMLGLNGYKNITRIQDSREVVTAYKQHRPELILLDLNMPYLDGFEVLEQLKSLDDPLLPPIVILTAQTSHEFVIKALESGARDFISKPFDQNELIMRVRNLLEAQLAHRMLYDQKSVLEEMVQRRTAEVQASRLQVVQRLGMAAEYRDEETGNHILRMSHISTAIARTMGWNEEQCDLMLLASPMHDIGKIGVPDAILLKPDKLNPEEWEIMKTHATIGGKLLDGDNTPLMIMAKEIALTHHEKWSGSGYPNGLAGDEIPVSGQIAAIADVFDALTSERPYKKAWPVDEALSYITEQKGRQFAEDIVEAFFDTLPTIKEIIVKYREHE